MLLVIESKDRDVQRLEEENMRLKGWIEEIRKDGGFLQGVDGGERSRQKLRRNIIGTI